MSDFQKDNVELMCDIGELVGLFDFDAGLDAFLAKAGDDELSPRARLIKKQIEKKAAEAAAAA